MNTREKGRVQAERLLRRVSLRTRKLRRQMIGWIRVGILEEVKLQFKVGILWVMSRGA